MHSVSPHCVNISCEDTESKGNNIIFILHDKRLFEVYLRHVYKVKWLKDLLVECI